ncbi:MAG: zinc dependent phospholipase C family protein [Gemmatimonadaceae bacterium]
MPGPLTYAAVTLLARDRLQQIRRALAGKQAAGTAKELELHVLHLATTAEEMMSAAQPVIEPPLRLYGPPLTDHVSRFTLLGAIGPDLPRYAAFFVPGKDWLFNSLHKGSPDEHREKVLVHSTDLVFDFWRRVGPLINSEFSSDDDRTQAKKKMQAYALGHLCHVATDVLSHPWFESIEARITDPTATPPVRRMRRDDVAGAFDVRIADRFFLRGTDTRTTAWGDWFPTSGEVPSSFAKAMSQSIAFLYSPRASGLPAFEEGFRKLDPAPPVLNEALIEESVESFRDIIAIERTWTLAQWLGATAAMFIPLGFAYFGALVLPLAKDMSTPFTGAGSDEKEAQRTYESVTYPLAVTALGPLVSMIIVSATGRGLRAEGITGWVQVGVSLVASVGFFASLGGASGAQWALFFWIPVILTAAQTIFAMLRGGAENSRKLIWLGPLVQLLLGTLFLLLYRGWLHEGVEELDKDADQRKDLTAFGDFALWMGIVLVLWFLHAVAWRYWFSSSVPDDQDLFSAGEPRRLLHLYEDVGMVHDAGTAFDSDRLTDLAYPSAHRPLYKLVWEPVGANTLTLRVDRDRLTFQFTIPAATPDRVVFAPVPPVTVEQFAALVARTVTGDASLGKLHVTPVRDDEKTLELPAGLTFSDHGDDLVAKAEVDGKAPVTVAQHDAEMVLAKLIGQDDASAFILFHAPRPQLALRMGTSGVAEDTRRREQASTPGSLLQPAPALTPRVHRALPGGGGASPFLRRLLRPGDVLEIASGGPTGEQRIVTRVLNDTDVEVSSPFLSPIAAGGIVYKRAASDRALRLTGTSQVVVPTPAQGIGPNDVQPDPLVAVTPFGAQFRVGDVVEVVTAPPQRRVVVAVKDSTPVGLAGTPTHLLELDAPLSPPPAAPVNIDRLGQDDADGFPFVSDANDVFGDGGSVMNDAADLAVLLCLGGASRLTLDSAPVTPAGAAVSIHRVSHVFRNWNLDRRRVNEWKMMVSGGAASERRGDFRASEEAAPFDPADAGEAFSDVLVDRRRRGEAIVLERGWLGVFRSWVDMASRTRTDIGADEVFSPGQPTNRELSRAMAYLLDAKEGVVA